MLQNPTCQVKDGSGAWQNTTTGAAIVTGGNVITVGLIDPAGVDVWTLQAVGADETTDYSTIIPSIDPVAKTATFTMPAGTGKSLILQSQVNSGIDNNKQSNPALTATLICESLTSGLGLGVLAINERFESDPAYGWVPKVNAGIRAAGTGTGATVADDIAKHVGVNIDRVRGQNGNAFANDISGSTLVDFTAPPRGGAWTAIPYNTGEANAVRFAPDNPVPQGWYDPRHYGAMFDGLTDDRSAWLAMLNDMPATGGHVHVPAGISWISDDIRVNKPVVLAGVGGVRTNHSLMQFAPGRKLVFDSAWMAGFPANPDAPSSAGFRMRNVDVRSYCMIHGTANGTANNATAGNTVRNVFSSGGLVKNGDCYVKSSNAAPTRCYRASVAANGGLGPGAFGSAEPAWSTTIGAVLTDNDITWTTEALIDKMHQTSTAYSVGDRVLAIDDNRYVFECIVAGTSSATRPSDLTGGDTAGGVVINGLTTDGTVVWVVRLWANVYVNSDLGLIRDCSAQGATGCGYHVQGGVGQACDPNNPIRGITGATNASPISVTCAAHGFITGATLSIGGVLGNAAANGSSTTITVVDANTFTLDGSTGGGAYTGGGKAVATTQTDADNTRIKDCFAQYCGAGVYMGGDDCNGYTIDGFVCLLLGWFEPHPYNGTDFTANSRGGHGFIDRSEGGGQLSNFYMQVSTGRPGLKSSGSSRLLLTSSSDEVNYPWHFAGTDTGHTVIVSGSLSDGITTTSQSVVVINPFSGRGVSELDDTGSPTIRASLTLRDGQSVYAKRAYTGNPDAYAMQYGATPGGGLAHYWGENWGPQARNVAYLLSTEQSGLNPGAGWQVYPKGYYLGDPTSAAVFCGDISALTYNYVRGGLRIAGDQFSNGSSIITITGTGYRGKPWASGPALVEYAPWAIPAFIVEPTANTGASGQKVFACTTQGTTGGSEPSWTGATTIGDTVTDGSVVWTLIGFTPTFRISGQADIDTRAATATTTATTANQVLASVTLPAAASGRVDLYRVVASFLGGGSSGRVTGHVEGSFEISAAGAITRLGSDDVSTPKGNGAAAGSAFSLVISGATIDGCATPGTATSTVWVTNMQLEKLTGANA